MRFPGGIGSCRDGGLRRTMKRAPGVGVAVLAALVLGPVGAPQIASGAPPAGGVSRVGVILYAQSGAYQATVDGLRQGLRELGLEEGRHLVLDVRQARGDVKAVEEAARDLERGDVNLLVTVTTSVTVAAKRATRQVPIVFYAGADPVAAGLVESLARPGGRLTGIVGRVSDLIAKRLEILKEILPKARRVVTFYDPDNAVSREGTQLGREAARKMGVELVERHVRSADELRLALEKLKPREVDAIFHINDSLAASQAPMIIEAARLKRLPTMFNEQSLVEQGAVAAYGSNNFEIGRQAAKLVQRVLAGTPPKDLPVENYDRIGLALNLRTAREIGLTIPSSVRQRADKVIE